MIYPKTDITRSAAMAVLTAILVAGTLLRLPGLTDPFGSSMDGWTGAFYSCMARNCRELSTLVPYLNPGSRGDPLIPYLNHPPSVPWLVASSFFLLGESEFAARLPFLVCSVLALGYAYRLGCRLQSRVTGLTAAMCLATTPVAVVYGPQVEIVGSHVLLAVLGLTLAHFDYYEQSNTRTRCRLGLWTIFAVGTDWPVVFLIAVLQAQAWVCFPAKRRSVIAATLFSAVCLIGVAGGLMSVDARFGMSHFFGKIYQRTFQLVTDSQGVSIGRSFTAIELFWHYLWLHWTMFGCALVLPALGWLMIAFRRETRGQAIPVVLGGFAVLFYAVCGQGHFQHDFWSHPVAATYALIVAAALRELRVGAVQTLWLAVLIALANLSSISEVRNQVIPRLSGSAIADVHHLVKPLVEQIPRNERLLVVDNTQWPTLPYYLGRNYVTAVSLRELDRVLKNEREAVPWQQYLFTHKLVGNSARDGIGEAAGATESPRWLMTREDAHSQFHGQPIALSGPWRLYDLTAERSPTTPISPPRLAPSSEGQVQHPPVSGFSFSGMFQTLAVLVMLFITSTCLPLDKFVLLKLSKALTRLSRHQWLPPVASGLTALMLAMVITAIMDVPAPTVHDEFANLLAADTFAHGRWANPTHPAWQHFESNHVFHTPVYQAKYPPVQGLCLAAGIRWCGHPIFGVWLSLGLGAAAVSWALQGWLPGRWALLGGMFVALNPMIAYRWGNTYWGGAAAMLGGALVYGGAMRLLTRPRWSSSMALGAGLAILANSRPFEGLVVSLPALLMVGHALIRGNLTLRARGAILLPLATVLVPVAMLMVQYNERLTGHPLKLPYLHHEEQYAVAPSFLWQSLRPVPLFRHESLRRVHQDWECAPYFEQRRSWFAMGQWCVWKSQILWGFFLGPILSLPLVSLAAAMSQWRARLVVSALGLLLAALVFHTYLQPHYAAPATVLVMAAVVHSLRVLRTWRWQDWQAGRFLVRGTAVIYLAALAPFLWSHHEYFARFRDPVRLRDCFEIRNQTNPGDYLVASAVSRRQMIRNLETLGGSHLVIVTYGTAHDPLFEWVCNEADIDAARIVWAHDMGQEANDRLATYFPRHRHWSLQVDGGIPQLIPGSGPGRDLSHAEADRQTSVHTNISRHTP